MTVFLYTLKRLLRSKLSLFFVFIITPLFLGVILFMGSDQDQLCVGLVDLDQTRFTSELQQTLADTALVRTISEDSIKSALTHSQVDYVLVVDPGFTQQLLAGGDPQLRSYSIQESNIAASAIFRVQSFLGAAQGLAKTAAGDETAFYAGLESYQQGRFSLNVTGQDEGDKDVSGALTGIGILAMAMLFRSTFAANGLIREREERTFFRTIASPWTLRKYMLQNILCYFAILLLQVTLAFLAIRYVFSFYLGVSVLNLFVVMAVFSLLCVAMGIALAALAHTVGQASTIASLIITPLGMLSGLFWPREIMPGFMQIIGRYLPPTWAMDAAGKVMQGKPLAAAGLELSILLGFTAVFFLLGTWRRVDVAR